MLEPPQEKVSNSSCNHSIYWLFSSIAKFKKRSNIVLFEKSVDVKRRLCSKQRRSHSSNCDVIERKKATIENYLYRMPLICPFCTHCNVLLCRCLCALEQTRSLLSGYTSIKSNTFEKCQTRIFVFCNFEERKKVQKIFCD